jgi:hypothetical protein
MLGGPNLPKGLLALFGFGQMDILKASSTYISRILNHRTLVGMRVLILDDFTTVNIDIWLNAPFTSFNVVTLFQTAANCSHDNFDERAAQLSFFFG